jgi:hypothetical protein
MNVRQLRWLLFVLDAAESWVDLDETPQSATDKRVGWITQHKRMRSNTMRRCWSTYRFVRLQMRLERKYRELGIARAEPAL